MLISSEMHFFLRSTLGCTLLDGRMNNDDHQKLNTVSWNMTIKENRYKWCDHLAQMLQTADVRTKIYADSEKRYVLTEKNRGYWNRCNG